jgi:hypothetical protein
LVHMGLPMCWLWLVTSGLAVAKEVFDHFHPAKHTCDPMDAVATICGCVPAHLVMMLLCWLL